jgi:single-strand DNA-binding protein
MLRVTLLGNLGADPEVRFSQKGSQLVQFRVAVNQVRTGADGERQENTEWFRIRVSGRQQEYAQRLVKGNRVLVIGKLDIGHYQSRDGEARVSYDVWADDIQTVSAPGGARTYAADMDGSELDADGAPEPLAAGVSSLNGSGATGSANGGAAPNGNASGGSSSAPPGRGRAARGGGDAGGRTPDGVRQEDLEDLPF